MRRYNEDGLSGLDDRRGREPRLPLTPQQQEQVRQALDAGPTDQDEVCSLRGKDVQRILAQEFNLLRSLAGRITCSIGSGIRICGPGRGIARPTPRSKRPRGKDAGAIDAKLVGRYWVALSRQQWARRKLPGQATPITCAGALGRARRASANS